MEKAKMSNGVNKTSLEELPDRVATTFVGKTVLLTGGTGFIGKVLVEKLLRVCPNIGGLILLIRPKKGKEPKQRLEQIFQGPLFEKLVKTRGMDYLVSRTRCVTGDVEAPCLGLSNADREICRNANIVIHSAASVRFDEGLKKAVLLNTRGTKYVLQLANECSKLELFVHVSTAYCHPEIKVLEEKSYPPPADPHELIQLLETTDEETIITLTPKLLGDLPNTYAYSKALSEALVTEQMENLPAIIVRPSVVVPIYKDPVPGWTDNMNGPAGLLIAAGTGVLRTMYGDEKNYADYMPVDIFVNVLMVITWNYLQNGNVQPCVMNFTSSDEVQFSWSTMLDIGKRIVSNKIPLNNCAWYPGGSMTRSRLYHRFRIIMYHWLPAVIVDTLLFCLGIKPVLLRVQRRISKGMEVFEYYTSNEWAFKSDMIQTVRGLLNERERDDYKMDSDGFDIQKYFEDCATCIRRYILKQPDETLPAAKRHMAIMWCLHLFVKAMFWFLTLYWVYRWASTSKIINTNILFNDNIISAK